MVSLHILQICSLVSLTIVKATHAVAKGSALSLLCTSTKCSPWCTLPPLNSQELTLQSCLIRKMEGLEGLTSLTRLTLYDNQILSLNVPPSLNRLTYLDMSYNLVKSMAALAACPLLEEVSTKAMSNSFAAVFLNECTTEITMYEFSPDATTVSSWWDYFAQKLRALSPISNICANTKFYRCSCLGICCPESGQSYRGARGAYPSAEA